MRPFELLACIIVFIPVTDSLKDRISQSRKISEDREPYNLSRTRGETEKSSNRESTH